MDKADVKEIEKDLGENFGPVLRGQAVKRMEKCHGGDKWIKYWRWVPCETRCISRLVVSKWNVA